MNGEYDLLIIEDSEGDAFLMFREISRVLPNAKHIRIETLQQLEEALTKPWDIILCDFNLPEFDAITALRLIRENDIDTPFILVSGLVEEGIAVSMMRLGANDYIMKDNLKRLGPAVLRELRETEIKNELKTGKAGPEPAAAHITHKNKPLAAKSSGEGHAGLLDIIEAGAPATKTRFIKERHKAIVNILYVAGLIKKHQNNLLEQHSLSEPQLNVLLVLARHQAEAITINVLKDELVNKTSDVSRLVDRMFKLGLINYTQNKVDKRARNVSISPKGLIALKELNSYADEMFLDANFLPEDTALVLNEQLKKILDAMAE